MAGVTEFNQKENSIVHIKKRNGYQVKFEAGKISDAIYKALVATGNPDFSLSEKLANKVVQRLVHETYGSLEIRSVEHVQDVVESSVGLIALSIKEVDTISNEHRSVVNRSISKEQADIEINDIRVGAPQLGFLTTGRYSET